MRLKYAFAISKALDHTIALLPRLLPISRLLKDVCKARRKLNAFNFRK